MPSFDETTETPSVPRDPLVGELIDGKYRVLGPLAQGGMARIYRAEQEPLGRIVAVKALAPNPNSSEAGRFEDRFFLEASTCAKLKHPNTVTLFDYGHHKKTGTYYMIMEMVEGRSLSKAIKDDGQIHPLRALAITIEICRSLQEAHQLGIVHRDLKPSNVMVTQTHEGESVKVLDFGIAKVLQADSQSITMEDRIVGSPRYMSPEQISQGTIDGRTDIYALGVMLFEMISGRAPYQGQTAIQTLMKHMNNAVPRLSTHTPSIQSIHPALDDLVASCMAKDPKQRPGSIDQLKNQLRQTLALVAESTEDMRMSTDSVVRHALAAQPVLDEVIHSQPTLSRPVTEESTFNQAAPVLVGLGGLTMLGTAGFALIVVGIGVAFVATRPAAPVMQPLPPPVITVPAPEEAPTLRLVSSPSGAEVFEDGASLGHTPLDLPMESGAQRRFELRLEGHRTETVSAGPLRADATVDTPLRPKGSSSGPAPGPAPAPSNPDLDIIDRR